MYCCRKIDGNKFSMFLNFFDVISKKFQSFFDVFLYVLSFYIMSFLYLCCSMFFLCFVIDPYGIASTSIISECKFSGIPYFTYKAYCGKKKLCWKRAWNWSIERVNLPLSQPPPPPPPPPLSCPGCMACSLTCASCSLALIPPL